MDEGLSNVATPFFMISNILSTGNNPWKHCVRTRITAWYRWVTMGGGRFGHVDRFRSMLDSAWTLRRVHWDKLDNASSS